MYNINAKLLFDLIMRFVHSLISLCKLINHFNISLIKLYIYISFDLFLHVISDPLHERNNIQVSDQIISGWGLGGGGGGGGGGGITSYIWQSTHVLAEWPPFIALQGI